MRPIHSSYLPGTRPGKMQILLQSGSLGGRAGTGRPPLPLPEKLSRLSAKNRGTPDRHPNWPTPLLGRQSLVRRCCISKAAPFGTRCIAHPLRPTDLTTVLSTSTSTSTSPTPRLPHRTLYAECC